MKRMLTILSASLVTAALAGCGPKDETPNAPELGTQVDRVGRPAISTATILTFSDDDAAKGTAKDDYNSAGTDGWSDYASDIQASLAIMDSLDETCGNQFIADADPNTRYAALAGVLADDRLWIDSSGNCEPSDQVYLGVEGNATDVVPNDLCGGRTLTMDIIETSYSVLAVGALDGVDDTITHDADCTQSNGAFPFVCDPS